MTPRWPVLLAIPAVLVLGCVDNTPTTSQQTPSASPSLQVRQHSQTQQQAEDALQKLNIQQNTIEDLLKSWNLTRSSTAGPQFDGELVELRNRIVNRCDQLEHDAIEIRDSSYLQQHAGVAPKVNEVIRFAQETRNEVRGQ